MTEPLLWRRPALRPPLTDAQIATQPPDDDALVRVAQRESDARAEAFAVLYRRHVDRVYRYLWVRIPDAQEAQDLTAQTFLAALEGLAGYRPQGKFAAWLLGIARRKVGDHFRQAARLAPLDAAEEVPHPGLSPEDVITRNLTLERVAAAMQALAPDRAEALALSAFGGLAPAEIAAVMGRSEAAARMLLYRAIHDLRARLAPQEEETFHD